MKFVPFLVAALLFSCDDENNTVDQERPFSFTTFDPEDVQFTEAVVHGELNIETQGQLKECGFVWSTEHLPTLDNFHARYMKMHTPGKTIVARNILGLKLNTKYYLRTYMISTEKDTLYGNEVVFSTPTATENEFFDFPGLPRSRAVAFIANGKGYVGLGYNSRMEQGRQYMRDLWELDFNTKVWTRKKDFPYHGLEGAVVFVINNKAFVGTGSNPFENSSKFYTYDAANDSWNTIADYPGGSVTYAVAFSVDDKGYVGTGMLKGGEMVNTFYEYSISGGWKKKADYPGSAIGFGIGFSIQEKGYIGMGNTNGNFPKQLWEYTPATDAWSQKSTCPSSGKMWGSVGFTLNNEGFVVFDDFDSFDKTVWKYNPANDSWTIGSIFKGSARDQAVSLNLSDRVYIGLGRHQDHYPIDFVEYIPE